MESKTVRQEYSSYIKECPLFSARKGARVYRHNIHTRWIDRSISYVTFSLLRCIETTIFLGFKMILCVKKSKRYAAWITPGCSDNCSLSHYHLNIVYTLFRVENAIIIFKIKMKYYNKAIFE